MRHQSGFQARARSRIVLLGVISGGLGLICLLALGPALRVLTAYQPPEASRAVAAASRDGYSERVVLVVVSRLANDDLSAPGDPWRFVELRRRAAEGARGSARAVQPSGDAPTWAALVSGAGPARSGIVDDMARGPLPIPTLFDQASAADKRSAVVAGPTAWKARSRLATPDRLLTAQSNAATGTAAVELLQAGAEPLVVVLLDAGRNPASRPDEIAERIDMQIGAIAAVLDPARDTLIVTGDHGVLPDGSSGGHEAAVLDVPLVLWGRAVVPGELGSVDQREIAPTVATLLGLPYSAAGGRPLLDALRLDDEARAREMVSLLDARIAVPPTGISAPGHMEATRRLEAARDSLATGDWARTRAEAEQGWSALALPAPSPRYVTSSWTWAVALPLLLLAGAGLIGSFRARLAFLLVPLAGLGGYLLLSALVFFGLAGKTISLSAIYGDWRANLAEIGLWSGLVLGVVAVIIGILRARHGTGAPIVEVGWSALLVLGCLGLVVLVYLVVVGMPGGRLPGLAGWAGLLIVMAQMAGAGLAAPPAMLLTAVVAEVVSRGR